MVTYPAGFCGQTIGYFISTHGEVEADIASLKKASKCSSTRKQPPRDGMKNKAIVLDAKILIRGVVTVALVRRIPYD